jgi:FAD/FMN-containing dehydrogenase
MLRQELTPAEQLAQGFAGELIDREHERFDALRAVYNGSINRRPAMIARCTGAADVIAAIGYAKAEGLAVGVRSGGHSVAGNGTCDDGVLLDLSPMKGVRVDPNGQTARVGAGVLWGEYDRETQVFDLATPGGRVTTTGVGGFTLGGGYGWISAKYGLTCDNLISADVVTAEGKVLTASEQDNKELFWGLRGGGGNFGVVTSFEFQLHRLGPMIAAGLMLWPLAEANEVMRRWRDFCESAPDEVGTGCACLPAAPPEEFVPTELHGRPVYGIIYCHTGGVDEGLATVQRLKDAGPAVDLVGPMPYVAFQAMLDPFAPPGWRNYHRGEHIRELPDAAVDAFVATAPTGLHPMTQHIMFRNGGAIGRVPKNSTAATHRDAPYMYHPIACWDEAARDDEHIDWVRRASDALKPFATGGVYLNFQPDEGIDRLRSGFDDETWMRLVALKDEFDPANMFRFNQNITPSSELLG